MESFRRTYRAKECVYRTCARPPVLEKTVASLSRNIPFSCCLLLLTLLSLHVSVFWDFRCLVIPFLVTSLSLVISCFSLLVTSLLILTSLSFGSSFISLLSHLLFLKLAYFDTSLSHLVSALLGLISSFSCHRFFLPFLSSIITSLDTEIV